MFVSETVCIYWFLLKELNEQKVLKSYVVAFLVLICLTDGYGMMDSLYDLKIQKLE